jgi:hypothetical protein
MRKKMLPAQFTLPVVCCFALLAGFLLIAPTSHAFEIIIDVSPNVLNLQNQGQVVTVHTDIDYGLVDVSSVYLNGVLINSWKADDRGYFVAKFLMSDVKALDMVIGDYNLLQMVGATIEGIAFAGEQYIKVVNNIPAGR